MTHTYPQTVLVFTVIWFIFVLLKPRSLVTLIGGLLAVGSYTLACLALGKITLATLGLGAPGSWPLTILYALLGLGVAVAYSPLADRLAARWFAQPPDLAAFRAIQASRANLIAGIAAAWVLGGFLEELVARGIVLLSVQSLLAAWIPLPAAAAVGVLVSAAGAGLMHRYQGPRAAAIITQISILFGLLFVLCGSSLWAVILCHGLYDTIAFIRFAQKKSRYANL